MRPELEALSLNRDRRVMENSGLAVLSWFYSKNEQHDPEQAFPSLGSFIHLEDQGQDRVCNLQGTAHGENGGFLLKKKCL